MLGAFNEGWVAACAGPLLKGNLPEGAALHKWECCQLGVKWELVGAEMGRMSWERGLQSTAPAHRRGRWLTLGVQQRRTEGIMFFPDDTVSCCSGLGGREEGRPAAQGHGRLVRCSCEPQPLWSWGLSKGRSCSRTGNPVAGSPGCTGSGSVPAVRWPKAIARDHITEPVSLAV